MSFSEKITEKNLNPTLTPTEPSIKKTTVHSGREVTQLPSIPLAQIPSMEAPSLTTRETTWTKVTQKKPRPGSEIRMTATARLTPHETKKKEEHHPSSSILSNNIDLVSRQFHPSFKLFDRWYKSFEKVMNDVEGGADFFSAIGASEERGGSFIGRVGSLVKRRMHLDHKEEDRKSSPSEALAEIFDFITQCAEYGVPQLFEEGNNGDKEKVKEETTGNILDRLLNLQEVKELLGKKRKESLELNEKLQQAREAIQKGRPAISFPTEMPLVQVTEEIAKGNGILALQLILAHRSNSKLKNIVPMMSAAVKEILEKEGLSQSEKTMALHNIISFLTEYVKRGDSIPYQSHARRALHDQFVQFIVIAKEALNDNKTVDQALRNLEVEILKSPLKMTPLKDDSTRLIKGLEHEKKWKSYFRKSLKLLAKAEKTGHSELAQELCEKLEATIIAKLAQPKPRYFNLALKLLNTASTHGLYQSDEVQHRRIALENAMKAAAATLSPTYKFEDGEQICQDLAEIFRSLHADLTLGEFDGCVWTKSEKEYVTPHINNITYWFNNIALFLVHQILSKGSEEEAIELLSGLIDAAALSLDKHYFTVYDSIMSGFNNICFTRLGWVASFQEHRNFIRIWKAVDLSINSQNYSRMLEKVEMHKETAHPFLRIFLRHLELSSVNEDPIEENISLENLSQTAEMKNRVKMYRDNLKASPKLGNPKRIRKLKLAIEIASWSGRLDDNELDRLSEVIKPRVV